MRYLILALCLLPLVALADINTAVMTSGNQTVNGVKTFSQPIAGSVTGDAGTLGGHDSGYFQPAATAITTGNISAQSVATAETVTNGVYTVGDQTIAGNKTFTGFTNHSGAGVKADYVIDEKSFWRWLDGNDGRPTLAEWQAAQTTTDLTATIQAAVNAAHGTIGEVYFPPGTYHFDGTVYVQLDPTTGPTGLCWKPIKIKGAGSYRASGNGSGGAGATVFHKTNAGAFFSVNLDSDGKGVTASGSTLAGQFENFFVEDIAFNGTAGVQTVGIKGYSTRAVFKNLSFNNLWIGWDFHNLDINGADNYCDMWNVDDVTFVNIGYTMFRQRNPDASVFKNLKCENFQSTAVGGFKISGGRGFSMPGLLINGLPATSSYVGFLYYASQANIQGGHFERNYSAAGDPDYGLSASGFVISGGNAVNISNNEFYNPDGAALTRPVIAAYTGAGHTFVGNTFKSDRASGYDVAVHTDNTLISRNITQDAVGAARAESTYMDPANTTNYSTVFNNVPLINDTATINTSATIGSTLISGYSVTPSTTNNEMFVQNRDISSANMHALTLASGTASNTSGTFTATYIKPTYNQTSGTSANTDLLINRTETAIGSGAQRLISGQVAGVEKFGVSNGGAVLTSSVTPIAADTEMFVQNRNITLASKTALTLSGGTISNTSGTFTAAGVKPVYNQASGSAANTDLLINRTETAIGSGTQRLISAGVGGGSYVEKFGVDNKGAVSVGVSAFASLGTVPAAGTMKYCTDCTTAATCAGSGTGHMAVSNGTNWTCQ